MRVLIEDSWLLASSILIGIGLLASSPLVIILGMLVLGASTAGRLWARVSLEEVYFTRALSERRLFVGETAELRLTLENRKGRGLDGQSRYPIAQQIPPIFGRCAET